MGGFSTVGGGITKLSQLEIDAAKDWQAKAITNLNSIAEAMEHGDIAFRGSSILKRLAANAGIGYNFLRSRGPGLDPVWEDIMSLVVYLTGALNRALTFDLTIPLPTISQVTEQASSPPGQTATPVLSIPQPSVGMVTEVGAGGGVEATPSLGIPAPGIALSEIATGELLGGAVADDGGVQTNETTPANNDTTNDMTLLPAAPAVDDAYYFGHASPWDWLELRIGTAGNGIWTIAWEYWNGTAWSALPGVSDSTSGFMVSGNKLVIFTRPADWAQTTVGGIANLYWIRGRVSAYTSITTQPKGNRAFIWIKH